jgi:RNA polymerase sigma-70 factor (ECF subfamily)
MPVLTLPASQVRCSAVRPKRRHSRKSAATPGRDNRRSTSAPQRWLEDPDVCLMLRVREGDDEAFDELARRYGTRVFGYFRRLVGDRQEAEDLTQEVFLRLFRARRRYQPKARFSTWVFHVTQNVGRNALRFRQRHPSVSLGTQTGRDSLLDRLLANAADTPSRPLERAELALVVRAAVADLEERHRTAIELHQFHDHTYAEVAAELSITPKAAKSLLYRIRNQLRLRLRPFFSAT